MEQGKSLSKNLLYTPLDAYLQNAETISSSPSAEDPKHPSQYMKNLQSSVPKSIHESSLPIFLHSVSQDYHRNTATTHDAKNNGSRPMSLDDIEGRIRQRAVTLLGGGINASLPTSSRRHSKIGSKRRRKWAWKQVEEACKTSTIVTAEMQPLDEADFLRKVNRKWNCYMWKILGLSAEGEDGSSYRDEMKNRLIVNASNMGRFEKAGAHVRIGSCKQHKAWTGRDGVIVSETLRTYLVAVVSRRRKDIGKEKRVATDGYKNIETLVVPKQGTVLVLLLPLPLCDPPSGEKEGASSSDVFGNTLVPLAAKTFCLTLKPGR